MIVVAVLGFAFVGSFLMTLWVAMTGGDYGGDGQGNSNNFVDCWIGYFFLLLYGIGAVTFVVWLFTYE